jgi:hypothetical protein
MKVEITICGNLRKFNIGNGVMQELEYGKRWNTWWKHMARHTDTHIRSSSLPWG